MSHKERFNQTLEIAQDMYENQLTLQQVADKHDMKRSTVHWRLRYFSGLISITILLPVICMLNVTE